MVFVCFEDLEKVCDLISLGTLALVAPEINELIYFWQYLQELIGDTDD